MSIWSAEIKELERLFEFFKGQFPELEKELERLLKSDDENIILVYSRRCLEVIITGLCECELKRERGTEPLKGIIDKLNKEKKVPSNIITSMDHLNSLSAYGAHPKDFDTEQVKPVLVNLDIIIKWYLKYKDTQAISRQKEKEIEEETKVSNGATEKIQKSNKKLILLLSGIALVVIIVLALFVFKIIGREKGVKDLEKSIAVLPFINDSPDTTNVYFINGIMERITTNLQMIKDLRVISRNSVEKYRNNKTKSASEIAKELGVNYIIEGSGQKMGNSISITTQLIKAKDKETHIWAKTYDKEIKEVDDYFRIQSEIAQTIATELEAAMTPEEKRRIEKIPTRNITAYDFYMKAEEYLWNFMKDTKDSSLLEQAERQYQKALDQDPDFAKAYIGLAKVYWQKNYWDEILTPGFMATSNVYLDRAFHLDDQLDEIFLLKGRYYEAVKDTLNAITYFNHVIDLNPNSWEAYLSLGSLYTNIDQIQSIKNLLKASELYHGSKTDSLMKDISWNLAMAGIYNLSDIYWKRALELNNDTAGYLYNQALIQNWRGNYEKSIEICKKVLQTKSLSKSTERKAIDRLAYNYMLLGKYEEAFKYYKMIEPKSWNQIMDIHRFALVYWHVGMKEEANDLFDMKELQLRKTMDFAKVPAFYTYYDLAGIYAFRGEKEKSMELLLEMIRHIQKPNEWFVTLIKNDPLFERIRDETEFRNIVRNIEAKYQASHERVRKWLEEQRML